MIPICSCNINGLCGNEHKAGEFSLLLEMSHGERNRAKFPRPDRTARIMDVQVYSTQDLFDANTCIVEAVCDYCVKVVNWAE